MKEWMGKLLELLNECRAEHDVYPVVYDEKDLDSLWILKRFVKWLVENDKIDFEWMSWHWKIISYLADEKDYKWNDIKIWVVLMLLSISDTPIEDLISYLK